MPHVRRTIEALRRQTYRNFEVLAQDGASTDGTVEYLNSITDLPRVEIVSQPDGGIGEAYGRGMARARGDLVVMGAADEYFDDDAFEKGARWFSESANAAVIYAGFRFIDANDRVYEIFTPENFDLRRFLHNEMTLLIGAAFLNRARIGAEFRYDESLETCPDFEFWIRLGAKFGREDWVVKTEPILNARGDRTSRTYRAENFDQFTRDKLSILERYLLSRPDSDETRALRGTASAGILAWAAECVLALEGPSPRFLKWCSEAATFDPKSARLARLARETLAFEIGAEGFRENALQPRVAPEGAVRVEGVVAWDEVRTYADWGSEVVRGSIDMKKGTDRSVHSEGCKPDERLRIGDSVVCPLFHVVTSAKPWAYSAIFPVAVLEGREGWYWATVEAQALAGQVAIGVLAGEDIFDERLIAPEDGRVRMVMRLNRPGTRGVMVRNGSVGGRGVVEIFSAAVVAAGLTGRVEPN